MIDQAIILATGRGVHLGPLTQDRPKAMLPALGKPFVVRVMERLREAGIWRYLVIVGEEEGEVAAYLNRSWYADTEIFFGLQMPASSLAETMRQAVGGLDLDSPFFLISSEILTPPGFLTQLAQRFEETNMDAVLGIVQTQCAQHDGLLAVKLAGDHIAAITQDPREVANYEYGAFLAYACNPNMWPYLTENRNSSGAERNLAAVLQDMINDDAQVGYALADWVLQLLRDEDLLAVHKHLFEQEHDAHILSELLPSVHITPPVRIDPQVSVGQGARIGPNVYLEAGCAIGQGAVVSNAVVLNKATIHAHEHITDAVIA